MTEKVWRNLFAQRMAEGMDRLGYNVPMLVNLTGITEMSLYRYLRAKVTPSFANAVRIAYALDVDLNYLGDFGETVDNHDNVEYRKMVELYRKMGSNF